MLRREGYEVLASGSGHEALEVFRKHGLVDVVLADIIMPGMSGTKLVREIAVISRNTATLLMTAALNQPSGIPEVVPAR